jgi:hypothetical protein
MAKCSRLTLGRGAADHRAEQGTKGAVANDIAPNRSATPDRFPRLPRQSGGALRTAAIVATLALVAGAFGWAAAGGLFDPSARPGSSPASHGGGGGGPGATPTAPVPPPTPTPRPPIGGTELYGYLPYWQMSDRMTTYLARVPVSTLALFSVSPASNGGVKTKDIGYRRITGERGRRLIADAHARGQRVELVFTSFGAALNTRLFTYDDAGQARRDRAVADLVALAQDLGVDGINVDVEQVKGDITLGYAAFIGALRDGLGTLGGHATLTVATTANHAGAELARVALIGGADRVFLMGYEYHWSGSGPGASAPIQNRDPGLDLMRSIADYVETGVARDRILLGLPLYGMTWHLVGPGRAFSVTGRGRVWIPANHAALLTSRDFVPTLDPQELAEYFIAQDGDAWAATYYDSPRTLKAKLELARSQGLAGSGFWALGYEYGLSGYVDLMAAFRAGEIGG